MGGRAHPEFATGPVLPGGMPGWSPLGRRTVLAVILITGAALVASAFYFGGGLGLDGSSWLLIDALEYTEGGQQRSVFDANAIPFTLSFKQRDFSGQGPVNSYTGTYRVRAGKVTVGQIARTEVGGSAKAMLAEERYFELLGSVARYEYVGERLVLFDAHDRVVLRYKRLQ